MNKVEEFFTLYINMRNHDIKPWHVREGGKIYPEDIRAMEILTRIHNDTEEQKRRTEAAEKRVREERKGGGGY